MLVTGPYGHTFEIPDEWWREAGLETGVPPAIPAGAQSYAVDPVLPTVPVPLQEIEPPRRAPGIVGLHRGQFVSVARAMAAGTPLPPVPVEALAHGPFRYMPRDGFHRYHASIALGFTHLPVFRVTSL